MQSAAEKTVANYDFIDAGSEKGKKIATELNLDIEKSAYVIDGERIVSHSDMALEVIHDMQFFGPALASLGKILPRAMRERMYEWLVKHRIK
jgi:predicted DCC family thiol-disulfide oxidoreductase YuxK